MYGGIKGAWFGCQEGSVSPSEPEVEGQSGSKARGKSVGLSGWYRVTVASGLAAGHLTRPWRERE